MKSVYLVFLIEQENNDHVLLFKKNPTKSYKLLKTQILNEDYFSTSIAAPKIILDHLNNIELQHFSFCKKEYLDCVDFESQEYAEKNIWKNSPNEEKFYLRHRRNLQSHLWTAYFNQCPLWNDDDELNFYYIIRLHQKDLQYMTQQKKLEPKLIKLEELNQSLTKPQQKYKELRDNLISKDYLRVDGRIILHFNFKFKQNMVYKAGGGYLDTVSIYNGLYRRKHDNWNQYNVAINNDYPSDEILKKAHCIIMPGHRISVYSDYQWIKDVKKILKQAYEINKKIKILGICFGFQLLTEALGGKVEGMDYGFAYGNTVLKHNIPLMKTFKLFQGIELKETTIINEAHGDEITKHPDYFVLLSSSDSCKNEIMISKDERLLMFQGHPEYQSASMKMLWIAGKLPSQSITLNEAIQELNRQYPKEQDFFHLQICFKFLKEAL